MKELQLILKLLTDTQLDNLEKKVWKAMTDGDGYQPWGYDAPTLKLTNPVEFAALLAVRLEQDLRDPTLPNAEEIPQLLKA